MRFPEKDGTGRNRHAHHFLKAQRLCAKLDLKPFRRVDGIRRAISYPVEFDNIRFPRKPKTKRPKLESARDPNINPGFHRQVIMDFVMKDISFRGENVFTPDPFNMHKRCPTLAEK